MLKLLTFTAALLAASTAGEVFAAEPAPRVVLLDALTLPAAFEQANVHGKVRDAHRRSCSAARLGTGVDHHSVSRPHLRWCRRSRG